MATANFCTMDNFSLFVKDYYEDAKRCPECGAIMNADATECDYCECDELEDYRYFDDMSYQDEWSEINHRLNDINDNLMFHKISLQSGYYTGVQFYVEAEHELDEYDYNNDDCHYYFDCCRSVAYRKYGAEKRKINRLLVKLGKEYGFEEIVCVARFSNGQAIYGLASNPRASLLAAVSA